MRRIDHFFSLLSSVTQLPFRVPYLSEHILQQVLLRCPVKEHIDASIPLFTKGHPADTLILILQVTTLFNVVWKNPIHVFMVP